MTPSDFKNRLNKIKALKDNGTYSFTEYIQQTEILINDLEMSDTKISTEDFLLQISDLIANGTVNYEMLERIKSILFLKNKPVKKVIVRPKIIEAGETDQHKSKITVPATEVFHQQQSYQKKNITGVFLLAFIFLCLLILAIWIIKNNTLGSESSDITDKNTIITPASDRVRAWINALGDQNFVTAYELLKGSRWGTYNQFVSKRSYGGVTSTKIWECYESKNDKNSSEVFADYDLMDPYNSDVRNKQKFILQRIGAEWYITDIKNLDVKYYRKADK